MEEELFMKLMEIVGSKLCVASDDGERVHGQIAAALKEGKKVKVSFESVESLTSAFLNSAIGQLYGEFPEEKIKSGLSVCDIETDDLDLLKRVVDTAKEYFKDPARVKGARKEILGDPDGR